MKSSTSAIYRLKLRPSDIENLKLLKDSLESMSTCLVVTLQKLEAKEKLIRSFSAGNDSIVVPRTASEMFPQEFSFVAPMTHTSRTLSPVDFNEAGHMYTFSTPEKVCSEPVLL